MDTTTLLKTNILDLLGLQHLPESKKNDLLGKMSQVVQDRITDRLLEAMSADQRADFDKLLDRNPDEIAVDAFLKNAVPDYEQIATQEILKFKSEMAEEAATVRQIALAQ